MAILVDFALHGSVRQTTAFAFVVTLLPAMLVHRDEVTPVKLVHLPVAVNAFRCTVLCRLRCNEDLVRYGVD